MQKIVLLASLLAAACGSTKTTQGGGTATTAEGSNVADTKPAQTTPPSVEAKFTVVYGLATFVMDSPGGQQDKAEKAVNESSLVSGLKAMGATVETVFDKTRAGDDVLVIASDGAEVARVPLIDLDNKESSGPALDKAKAKLGK